MELQLNPITAAASAAAPIGEVASPGTVEKMAQPASVVSVAAEADSSEVAKSLNSAARLNSTALEFSVDEATHSQVVIVRDAESGEVILQYPSEEALRMIRNLEAGVGGLVDQLI